MTKRKQFLKDIMINVGAFGVYMLGHHILMMPFLAKILDVDLNAKFLLFIMLASIATVSLGNELGVAYQVYMGRDPKQSVFEDTHRLLQQSNLLTFLIFIPLLLLLGFPVIDTIFLGVATVMTNARLFYHSILRHRKRFVAIFISNTGYLVGVALSLIIVWHNRALYWLPLFLGELLSTGLTLVADRGFRRKPETRSDDYPLIRRQSLDLVGASILGNIPSYGDKIMVLPLLGSLSMSAYYAGTSLSKLLMLVVNPINGVLLSWLSTDTESTKETMTRRLLRVNVIIVIGLFFASFPIIVITTFVLYRQFYSQVMQILPFLALSSAFLTSTTILRVVFLRYYKIEAIKFINLLKIILFVVLSPIGVRLGGLLGFSVAVAVSNIILWMIYYISMWRTQAKPD